MPDTRPRTLQRAMLASLGVGVVMFTGKVGAYALTGSAAILSDAAESVIHVAAVAFATFSLYMSARPADQRYRYGYERIAYFSAGFEGALIVVAAVYILREAVAKWIAGARPSHLGAGAAVVLAAGIVNLALGGYLVRTGRRCGSLILEADGKHVLTDSWTSFGVVGGLAGVLLTGWTWLDPLVAIAVALNILLSGTALVWRSVSGLMDVADPKVGRDLRRLLDDAARHGGFEYHDLRWRSTGVRTRAEVHLLFPQETAVGDAHATATRLEDRARSEIDPPVELLTHLEAAEDHDAVHRRHPAVDDPGDG